MKRKTMPYSIQNGRYVYLLPAGRPENRDDLNKQLGFIEDRWPFGLIVLACTALVLLMGLAIFAGLTYPQWKHLLK